MSITIDQMEEIMGRVVNVNTISGNLGKTPDSNSEKWRYPYSVFFVDKGIHQGTSMIRYVTIPHTKSELRQEDHRVYIEAEALSSNPGLIFQSNPQYEEYAELVS